MSKESELPEEWFEWPKEWDVLEKPITVRPDGSIPGVYWDHARGEFVVDISLEDFNE